MLVPAYHAAILVFPICHAINLFQSLNLQTSSCQVNNPQDLQFVPSEPQIRPEHKLYVGILYSLAYLKLSVFLLNVERDEFVTRRHKASHLINHLFTPLSG